MSELAGKKCIPCEGGVPALAEAEAKALLGQLRDWKVIDNHHLSKEFGFDDFKTTLAFVNKLGDVAESEGHHPDIYFTWGKARIDIWTHKIDGLTESDFILAAKIDALPS